MQRQQLLLYILTRVRITGEMRIHYWNRDSTPTERMAKGWWRVCANEFGANAPRLIELKHL